MKEIDTISLGSSQSGRNNSALKIRTSDIVCKTFPVGGPLPTIKQSLTNQRVQMGSGVDLYLPHLKPKEPKVAPAVFVNNGNMTATNLRLSLESSPSGSDKGSFFRSPRGRKTHVGNLLSPVLDQKNQRTNSV